MSVLEASTSDDETRRLEKRLKVLEEKTEADKSEVEKAKARVRSMEPGFAKFSRTFSCAL